MDGRFKPVSPSSSPREERKVTRNRKGGKRRRKNEKAVVHLEIEAVLFGPKADFVHPVIQDARPSRLGAGSPIISHSCWRRKCDKKALDCQVLGLVFSKAK
jgi:hypothetical protein